MLILPAYAKLNLALDVVRRREDGWHDIDTVLVPIDWHDIVGVTLTTRRGAPMSLRITGAEAAGVPTDESNVAWRAGHELLARAGVDASAEVWLEKRIPHGAGLGGGSADAAAVLRALQVWLRSRGVTVGRDDLLRAALAAGSDVPALVAGGVQRVTGRGDALETLPDIDLRVVVVMTQPSATGATYAAFDAAEPQDEDRIAQLADAVTRGELPQELFGSALEAAACRASPQLRAAVHQVRAAEPSLSWHMTGSGGALFALIADDATCRATAQRMRARGYAARACRTVAAQPRPA